MWMVAGLARVVVATWQSSLHSPDKPDELSQCLKHDDSTKDHPGYYYHYYYYYNHHVTRHDWL